MINLITAGLALFSKALDRSLPDNNLMKEISLKEFELGIEHDKLKIESNLEIEKIKSQLALTPMLLANELDKAQIEVNKAEAQSDNLFKSGWRPMLGWICVLSFLYSTILYPVLSSFIPALKNISSNESYNILIGMLGLGTLRTYEKVQKKMGK